MPEGFEKQVTPRRLADLLEFLTQRGKYLPLPLDKVATIVSTRGMFYDEDAEAERLVFADWSPKTFEGVPFQLVDPQGDRVAERRSCSTARRASSRRQMPKSVTLPCNAPAKAIHLLSGVSGWGYPGGERERTVSLIVRLHYADGTTRRSRAEERRALRRLHPPRRRARLASSPSSSAASRFATWRCSPKRRGRSRRSNWSKAPTPPPRS